MITPGEALRIKFKVNMDKFSSPIELDIQVNKLIPYLQKRYHVHGECEVFFNFTTKEDCEPDVMATFIFYEGLRVVQDGEMVKC